MLKYLKTRDLPLAAFLVTNGFECIGTVPTEYTNARGAVIKDFVIEYDESKENALEDAVADYEGSRTQEARYARNFYKVQKTVKHYLDDDKK